MPNKVKFLHAADLHLGSPLKSVGNKSSEIKTIIEKAGYTALERLTNAAIRHKVDFVLFSGDIYDQEVRSVTANQVFIDNMKKLEEANINVYIIYGNHDPLDQGLEYFKFPGNVHVFPSDKPHLEDAFDQDGKLTARVLGQSYRNPSDSRKMHESYNPPDQNTFNIGLLHTGLNPSMNKYVPCSELELKEKQALHYWALGHEHHPKIISNKRPAIAFPGIIQGREPGEPGCKGCLLVSINPGEDPVIAFIPTSPVMWLKRKVAIRQDDQNIDDLKELLLEEGQKILDGDPTGEVEIELANGEEARVDGYIVRWELTGRGPVHKNLIAKEETELGESLAEELRKELGIVPPFVWTESIDFSTAPPLPEFAEIPEEDAVLQELNAVYRAIKEEGKDQDIIDNMGEIWFEPDDHEAQNPNKLPITGEHYNRIIEKAYRLAVERLVEGREHS
ncbi:MAG: DNA repair exonuclease [Bacillota bacterium]